jgi:hypothetical protein
MMNIDGARWHIASIVLSYESSYKDPGQSVIPAQNENPHGLIFGRRVHT